MSHSLFADVRWSRLIFWLIFIVSGLTGVSIDSVCVSVYLNLVWEFPHFSPRTPHLTSQHASVPMHLSSWYELSVTELVTLWYFSVISKDSRQTELTNIEGVSDPSGAERQTVLIFRLESWRLSSKFLRGTQGHSNTLICLGLNLDHFLDAFLISQTECLRKHGVYEKYPLRMFGGNG